MRCQSYIGMPLDFRKCSRKAKYEVQKHIKNVLGTPLVINVCKQHLTQQQRYPDSILSVQEIQEPPHE